MNEFWSEFITKFALALIPVVVPLVVAKVFQLWAKGKQALTEWNPTLAYVLEAGAKMVVSAAEQAGAAQLIADKKEYAINALQKYLADHGFGKVDLVVIDAAIEDAVKKAAFEHSRVIIPSLVSA